jgi:hypothetical protein
MLEYHCEWDPIYPEKPDRILKPYERCQLYNLIEKCVDIKVTVMLYLKITIKTCRF